MTQPENKNVEEWRNEEPFVSIEGAMWDVKNGVIDIEKAMEWVHDYITTATSSMKTLKTLQEKAMRDICSVSVAPASKSEVNRILTTFTTVIIEQAIEKIEEGKQKLPKTKCINAENPLVRFVLPV